MFAVLESDPAAIALEAELREAEASGLALLEAIEREREARVTPQKPVRIVPEIEWVI